MKKKGKKNKKGGEVKKKGKGAIGGVECFRSDESNRENFKKEKSFFRKLLDFISIKKNPAFTLILVGFFLNLAGVFLLYKTIAPTNSGVILHYNSFLGIDVIAFDLERQYYKLFLPSMVGILVFIVNTVLAILINFQNEKINKQKNKDQFIVRRISFFFLLNSSILVQLAILVYILAIVRVNG